MTPDFNIREQLELEDCKISFNAFHATDLAMFGTEFK